MAFCPTVPFTILEPQDQEIVKICVLREWILKLRSCEKISRALNKLNDALDLQPSTKKVFFRNISFQSCFLVCLCSPHLLALLIRVRAKNKLFLLLSQTICFFLSFQEFVSFILLCLLLSHSYFYGVTLRMSPAEHTQN